MANKDALLRMWSYWRDKYGEEEALKTYYPELLSADDVLRTAVAQIRMATLAIEARMRELEQENPHGE